MAKPPGFSAENREVMAKLGLGTAQLGTSYGVANKTGAPDRSEVSEIISTAL